MTEAGELTEDWLHRYNSDRPHEALPAVGWTSFSLLAKRRWLLLKSSLMGDVSIRTNIPS